MDVVPADASNLRMTEIHYHPADPSAAEMAAGFDTGDDFEFLELLNISSHTVDLSQVQLQQVEINGQQDGVDFHFAEGDITQLGPGQRLLVVEDLAAFQLRYGDDLPVAGQWSGRLRNSGEQLTLIAGTDIVQQFSYDDAWYPQTDGQGASLEIIDPHRDQRPGVKAAPGAPACSPEARLDPPEPTPGSPVTSMATVALILPTWSPPSLPANTKTAFPETRHSPKGIGMAMATSIRATWSTCSSWATMSPKRDPCAVENRARDELFARGELDESLRDLRAAQGMLHVPRPMVLEPTIWDDAG